MGETGRLRRPGATAPSWSRCRNRGGEGWGSIPEVADSGQLALCLCGVAGGTDYILGGALLAREITVGAFAAVFSSVGMMFGIMEEVVCRHVGDMMKNLATVRNFGAFLDVPERGGAERPLCVGGGIALEEVSFRYPGKTETPSSPCP